MKRRNLTPNQKFSIVLESFQNNNVAQVARKHDINPNLISNWRKQFQTNGPEIFSSNADKEKREMKRKIDKLEQMIGKKEVEINLLQNFFDEYK